MDVRCFGSVTVGFVYLFYRDHQGEFLITGFLQRDFARKTQHHQIRGCRAMVSKNRRAACVGVLPEEVTRCFDHSLHNAALVLQWPRLSSPRRPTHRTLPVRICSREGLSECIGFFAETNNSPTTHGCVLTYFIIPSLFLPLLPPKIGRASCRERV